MKKLLSFFVVFLIIILVGIVSINLISLKYPPYTAPKIDKDVILVPLTTSTSSTPEKQPIPLKLGSRIALERAETIVKEKKLSPPVAARLYAYVATAYFDSLQLTKNSELAQTASKKIIEKIFPDSAVIQLEPSINTTSSLNITNSTTPTSATPLLKLTTSTTLPSTDAIDSIQDLLIREKNDGFYSLNWDGKIPAGKGKWKNTPDVSPTTPRAGEWQRWIIPANTNFSVIPAPIFNSPEYKQEIEKLITTTSELTSEQKQLLQTWDTDLGNKTISGLWQDKLWQVFQEQNPSPASNTDLKYAYFQKILAQGLADAIMECWKIKFTYWTARPEMVNKIIKPISPTPPSPSYVSEQTVASKVAAEILEKFFPNQKNAFVEDAKTARDIAVWSGINFDIDTQEGFKLGEQIGKEVVKHIGIIE